MSNLKKELTSSQCVIIQPINEEHFKKILSPNPYEAFLPRSTVKLTITMRGFRYALFQTVVPSENDHKPRRTNI